MSKAPITIVCYLCGREYGRASIEIHQKQCKEKWIKIEEKKPKHLRQPVPSPPAQPTSTEGLSPEQVIALQNEAAYASFNTNTLVPCERCGRTFLEDSLKVHLRSCKGPKKTQRRGSSGSSSNQLKSMSAISSSPKCKTAPESISNELNDNPSMSLSGPISSSSNRKHLQLKSQVEQLEKLLLTAMQQLQQIKQSMEP